MADSDDEVVDHASLLNSFGNDNTNIITPVPRMHSIKPEWDEDVSRPSQAFGRPLSTNASVLLELKRGSGVGFAGDILSN